MSLANLTALGPTVLAGVRSCSCNFSMSIIDFVVIGVMVVFMAIGAVIGFGKGLKIFTGGIVGALIAIVICFVIGGTVLQISFVSKLVISLRGVIARTGGGVILEDGTPDFSAVSGTITGAKKIWSIVCRILLTIHIEKIIFYIVLFIIVFVLRAIIVKIIASVAESDNVVIKIFDKAIFGPILFLVIYVFVILIVFSIVALIGGNAEQWIWVHLRFERSVIMKWLYEFNPLMYIFRIIFRIRIEIPVAA